MTRFLFPVAVILSGLLSGFAFARLVARNPRRAAPAERARTALQRFALLGLNPVAFAGAVWSLDLGAAGLLALPVVGLSTLGFGVILGAAGSRFLRLPPSRAGVYIPAASFTNIGSIGGLVIYVLLGEAGFALMPFYKLFEETWYFSVLFPIARRCGERTHPETAGASRSGGPGRIPGKLLRDPFIVMALASVTTGIVLNLSGLPRPALYSSVNSVTIPLASWILLFTIGMRMKTGGIAVDPRTTALLMTCKTFLVPAFAFALGTAFGLGGSEDAIALKTVLVLSAMPIGFLGVVPASLYRLDEELAYRLWLVSNAALVLTVPVLSFLVGLL